MTEQHSLKMTLNLTGDPQGHPIPVSALIKHVPEGERPPSLEHSPALVICQSRNVGNKKTLFRPWAVSSLEELEGKESHLPVPKSCTF